MLNNFSKSNDESQKSDGSNIQEEKEIHQLHPSLIQLEKHHAVENTQHILDLKGAFLLKQLYMYRRIPIIPLSDFILALINLGRNSPREGPEPTTREILKRAETAFLSKINDT